MYALVSGMAGVRARRPNFARASAGFLNPQLTRQNHKMWGSSRAGIQDSVVAFSLQDDQPVDILCANCDLDPFFHARMNKP